MNQQRQAFIGGFLCLASGLCFSSGGYFVRSVSIDGWEIIFFRCLFAAITIIVLLVVRERERAIRVMWSAGWPSVVVGFTTAWAIIAYVLAIRMTLVANVIAIMTTSTVMVALLAGPMLGERVALRTWLAMLASLLGIGVMFSGSTGAGSVYGNLLAVSIAIAIAVQTLFARRHHGLRMETSVIVAAFVAGLVALPLALPLEATTRELGIMALFGGVQLAGALVLYFQAARFLPAPVLIFVVLIDAVFAPIWVWLAFDEVPGNPTFAGAGIILAAVLVNTYFGVRRVRTH